MTIDEAIKENEAALADKWCPWSPELKASIGLGIEALKYIVYRDNCPGINTRLLLPGETED